MNKTNAQDEEDKIEAALPRQTNILRPKGKSYVGFWWRNMCPLTNINIIDYNNKKKCQREKLEELKIKNMKIKKIKW